MGTSTLEEFKKHLRPGRVYRREGLAKISHSVDRHLRVLTESGFLKKLQYGLYHYPEKVVFGEVPAGAHELVRAFLKTDHFLVMSPNAYNMLGVGTTQLYNKQVVYNQKRHGVFNIDGRTLYFERRLNVPKKLSVEFLLVDLVNELDQLAEDRDVVLSRVYKKTLQMNHKKLARAVSLYGNYSTKKKFEKFLNHG